MYLHLFEKNTGNAILPSCHYVHPHIQTLRTHPPVNIRQKEESHCSYHCPENLERSSERFSHKSKISFRWITFSSPPETRRRGSQMDSGKTYKSVMISHHRPFILRKRSKLWKECFISDIPTNTPKLPSDCSLQEKSLQAPGSGVRSEWRLQDK